MENSSGQINPNLAPLLQPPYLVLPHTGVDCSQLAPGLRIGGIWVQNTERERD